MDKTTKQALEEACRSLFTLARERDTAVTLESLIAAAQDLLSKPVRLRRADFGATEIFGIWLELPESHTILFDESASPAHQSHIIQHELGHILLGHRSVSALRCDRQPVEQCRLMLRHNPVDEREAEAEAFAIQMTRMLQTESWRHPVPAETEVARRIWNTLAEEHLIDRF
ncbi:ImmA/IrrE family metallo-endopeptidase [Segniliparus rugosus]|uniref:Uncharacterized protein n=1 Tax=Segniliparus rugosus (strain ATCC BAA-974 / DSM 45345 / CCUG 50838 / CIP 108380 / JCM 13579 / CDC 945) TaxID=679197 RepID=E5XKT7_SEGRC|nr:ImmA/IrrE family metallo-endopeptidase [Segniliparus rugosus]EFV15050.1 hypothetical protein HMPREF9336_00106 [Segniliparus rugosus ATCC BAA-974]